jgi:predicted CoA-binding protein
VLGLSPDESKDSNKVARYLQSVGYQIIPVYPKADEDILGEKVYTSLADVPGQVDMINIFRKPNALDPIADTAIARGDVKVFWSQIGIVNNAAAQKAEDAGMQVVQNHCSMVEHRKLLG